MALEDAEFISGLVAANPPGTDAISEGDNHIRLIKTVLQASLPNANAAINGIHTSAGVAPSSTSAGQLWFDTSTDLLKMRNEADDGWVVLSSSEGSNVINVAHYEDSTGTSVRSSSFTDVFTFTYSKISATSDLYFTMNVYAAWWNYGTTATGTMQLWDNDNSARIGAFDWDGSGTWNNMGTSASSNNQVNGITSWSAKESTPLSVGTKTLKLRVQMDQPGDGGASVDDLSVLVMEVE